MQILDTMVFRDRDFISFASPLPAQKPRYLALLTPFDYITWGLLIIAVPGAGFAFYVIANIEVGF